MFLLPDTETNGTYLDWKSSSINYSTPDELKGSTVILSNEDFNNNSLLHKTAQRLLQDCRTIIFPAVKSLLEGTVHREIYLPQWGDLVRVTESFEIHNAAAGISGNYPGAEIHTHTTRYIGYRRASVPKPTGGHLFTLEAILPPNSVNVEY